MRIPGFDLGNSPREFLEPAGRDARPDDDERNPGARDGDASAASACFAGEPHEPRGGGRGGARGRGGRGDLLRRRARASSRSTTPTARGASPNGSAATCPTRAAAAIRISGSFGTPEEGLRASKSARNLIAADLEEDIAFCARESVLEVVPRVAGVEGRAVELVRLTEQLGQANRHTVPDLGQNIDGSRRSSRATSGSATTRRSRPRRSGPSAWCRSSSSTTRILRSDFASPNRVSFLLDSLADLDESLRARSAPGSCCGAATSSARRSDSRSTRTRPRSTSPRTSAATRRPASGGSPKRAARLGSSSASAPGSPSCRRARSRPPAATTFKSSRRTGAAGARPDSAQAGRRAPAACVSRPGLPAGPCPRSTGS